MSTLGLGYSDSGHIFYGSKNESLKMGFKWKMDKGQHSDYKTEASSKKCMYVCVEREREGVEKTKK